MQEGSCKLLALAATRSPTSTPEVIASCFSFSACSHPKPDELPKGAFSATRERGPQLNCRMGLSNRRVPKQGNKGTVKSKALCLC